MLPKGKLAGQTLKYFIRFIGFGGRERVKGRESVRKKERERE